MPDRSDVEQALAGLIADTLYPNGTDADSAIGTVCKVYRGWPVAGALDNDLERGIVNISIIPVSGSTRNRTRYPVEWQGSCPAPTLTATVNGDVVAFAGSGGAGQVAGVAVDGQAYAYRLQAGDSATLVAAALAALVRADRPALAVNSSIYLISGRNIFARIVTDGQGGTELRRQEAGFRITFWCPDPSTRDAVVSFVDVALATLTFIDVGGWACRMQFSSESITDEGSAGSVWRRDLLYSVEYPTVASADLPAMLFGVADVNSIPFIG